MIAVPSRRIASLGAAVALGLGGSVAAAPSALSAPQVKAAAVAALSEQAPTDDGVQGFSAAADGQAPTLFAVGGTDALEKKTRTLVTRSGAQVVALDSPATAVAANPKQVIGGKGYITTTKGNVNAGGELCSIGFSALSSSFAPQALSAGHCASDGKRLHVNGTKPSADDASNRKSSKNARWAPDAKAFNGRIAKWQFGARGQTKPEKISDSTSMTDRQARKYTDYSIVNLAKGASLTPYVTRWNRVQAKKNDLSSTRWNVTGTSVAKVGQTVNRSGRTTGSSSGKVLYSRVWLNVEGRRVYGFLARTPVIPGDSGGPFLNTSGKAVGIASATVTMNGRNVSFAADLQNALDRAGTKTRVLTAAKAKVKKGAVKRGGYLRGTVVRGYTGGTFVASNGARKTIKVSKGSWRMPVGKKTGTFSGKIYLTTTYAVTSPVSVKYKVKK